MKSSFKFLLLQILLCVNTIAFAQQELYTITVTDTIPINLENRYNLLNVSIIPFSESIRLRDSLLQPGDYTIQYSTATFSLSPDLPYSILDTLIVTYDAFHLGLRKEYKHRSLVIRYDDKYGDTVRVIQAETGGFSPESIFGSSIQKSGTIVRGFTVGTTKDFTLNSGLRLQLSGRLSDDIEIVAALTDENTPIQPEGNTERLEELDKVFIQIRHPNAAGTFGDYQFRRRQGQFGFVDRKLQGLLGEFLYEDHDAYVAVAGSRGKFNSNQFNGTDGNQGTYRLSGINNERDIIIIAGTEKVYLDGIEMRRGENNDYAVGGVYFNDTSYGVIHWNGVEWRPVTNQAGGVAIHGFSANDIWTVGGGVYHFNGVEWKKIDSYSSGGQAIPLDKVLFDNLPYSSVWGTSSSNMYFGNGRGKIVHWDGSKATVVYSHYSNVQVKDLDGIAPDFIIGVGSGFIPPLLAVYYNGISWNQLPIDLNWSLNSVAIISRNKIYFGGDGIFEMKGNSFSRILSPGYYVSAIEYNRYNGVTVGCGHFGGVYINNGLEWRNYQGQITTDDNDFVGIFLTNNTIFCVGRNDNQAIIIIGKNN